MSFSGLINYGKQWYSSFSRFVNLTTEDTASGSTETPVTSINTQGRLVNVAYNEKESEYVFTFADIEGATNFSEGKESDCEKIELDDTTKRDANVQVLGLDFNKEDSKISFEFSTPEGANRFFERIHADWNFMQDTVKLEETSNKVHFKCTSMNNTVFYLGILLGSLVSDAKNNPFLKEFFTEPDANVQILGLDFNKEDSKISLEFATLEEVKQFSEKIDSNLNFLQDTVRLEEISNKVHITCASMGNTIFYLGEVLETLDSGAKNNPHLEEFFAALKVVKKEVKKEIREIIDTNLKV